MWRDSLATSCATSFATDPQIRPRIATPHSSGEAERARGSSRRTDWSRSSAAIYGVYDQGLRRLCLAD